MTRMTREKSKGNDQCRNMNVTCEYLALDVNVPLLFHAAQSYAFISRYMHPSVLKLTVPFLLGRVP